MKRRTRPGRRRTSIPAVARAAPVPIWSAGSSATAVMAEALRTGYLPCHLSRSDEISAGADAICVGDPDDRFLSNQYVGEETPGGTNPTPDQNGVDDIGRAYGLQEEDSGGLRSAAEILGRRDRHRYELRPPRRPRL